MAKLESSSTIRSRCSWHRRMKLSIDSPAARESCKNSLCERSPRSPSSSRMMALFSIWR